MQCVDTAARAQRQTIMEVRRRGASNCLRRTACQSDGTALRSRLLKQHSASERVIGD
jgi:hypothetical protein